MTFTPDDLPEMLNESLAHMDIPIRVSPAALTSYRLWTDAGTEITGQLIKDLVTRINIAADAESGEQHDGQGLLWRLETDSLHGTRVFWARWARPMPQRALGTPATDLDWKSSLARLADILTEGGWSVSYQYGREPGERTGRVLRAEGIHSSGAAVLVSGAHTGPARYYIYHPSWEHWGVANLRLTKTLIADPETDIAPHVRKFVRGSDCDCGKRHGHPTQRRAEAELEEVLREWTPNPEDPDRKPPAGTYRCLVDTRMWHHTSKSAEDSYPGNWVSLPDPTA